MTDLTTLRQQRDAARFDVTSAILRGSPITAYLDTLLRLHAQVTTLENAEKLYQELRDKKMTAREVAGWANAADFLRARLTVTEGNGPITEETER